MIEKLRLDRYLWAIRIFKTRSLASAAIDSGKVKINETSVKPARTVNIGDRYTIRTPERNWNIEVTALLQNRVAFPEAIKHYKDHTPEADKIPKEKLSEVFFTGKRMSKTGKPTKKQRRDFNDFHGDNESGSIF